ncbi:MAG: hypothetical protein COA61_003460 [Zetaproteobacteria bacterium]|nr:hypothetical protein [Zetaproteobacteria bacterium]
MSQDEVNLDKKKPSFKHLGILRQAISKAHTGNIRYETVENEEIKMNMLLGNLLSDSMTVNGLEKFLTFPCMDCKFSVECAEVNSDDVAFDADETLNIQCAGEHSQEAAPPIVLTRVLNGIHWEDEVLIQLKESFSQLPPVEVKMVPMHHYGYNDTLTYLTLYQTSLKNKDFTLAIFFDECPSYISLEQQVKVLVLGYCLDLIKPKASAKKVQKKKSRRLGIVNRILNKIREI